MEYNIISYRKKIMCANCGRIGHEIRMCNEPITSFGIINIKILDDVNESLLIKDKFSSNKNSVYKIFSRKYPDIKCCISDSVKLTDNNQNLYRLDNENIPYDDAEHIEKFCYYKNKILFMMVSRRFSLGFVEFIRGKYDVCDTNGIINLFEQMYDDEICMIKRNTYDTILYYFLNRKNESKDIVLNRIYEGKYANEYCEAKIKFDILRQPRDENSNVPWDLNFYTKHIKPRWKKPEWGFPKGRRDKRNEENVNCACREFEEETGYNSSGYVLLNKIEPIEETLTGTNGVNYKHIYYLAINKYEEDLAKMNYDSFEIGEIRWFTYEEAMTNIRPYHKEKKKILTRIYLFIMNYLVHNGHCII